jgi:hypothetical protein
MFAQIAVFKLLQEIVMIPSAILLMLFKNLSI